MKKTLVVFAALAGLAGLGGLAAVNYLSEPEIQLVDLPVGRPAPNFTLPDANARPVGLSDFRGKTVVLEWNNPGCPFVKKQYAGGTMQGAQAAAAKDGVVWLTINSGAPGKQGHMDGDEAKAFLAESGARPAAYLLDPRGQVGRAYGARTTPHMFVINGAGTLVYAGAIDNSEGSDRTDIKVRNHVLAALSELNAGQKVSVPTSRPFGCSVKYAAG
jgi:AhpC/TSA family